MTIEEVPAPAEGAEVASRSPASTTDTDAKETGGCCSSTKKFFLYDSTRPEIQAFYFNQVRYVLRQGVRTYPTAYKFAHKKRSFSTHDTSSFSLYLFTMCSSADRYCSFPSCSSV